MAALRDELMDLRTMLGPAVLGRDGPGSSSGHPVLPHEDAGAHTGATQHVSVHQLKRLCEHYADQVPLRDGCWLAASPTG